MLDELIIPEFEQMMVNVDSNDTYINQLFDIYHQHLLDNDEVCELLTKHGLSQCDIESKRLGYCDRKLNRYIECSDTVSGGSFRGALKQLELIKPTGHELFCGCIVEPIINDENQIIAVCGIKFKRQSRFAPYIIQWFRHSTYLTPIKFTLLNMDKSYVH